MTANLSAKGVPPFPLDPGFRREVEAAGNLPASIIDVNHCNKMVYNTGSGGGGNCTRRSDSSSRVDRCPCKIDGGRCVGNRSKPRDTNAGPRRDRHPVAVPAIANCARHNGACPVPELTSSCVGSPKNLRASVRHTDACHSQGAQGTDGEPPKLAHVRQPMTEVISPAWGFLARSKRGTRPMPAWLFGGTRQRRIQFCASGWEETKEGAAVWWRSPDDRTWL